MTMNTTQNTDSIQVEKIPMLQAFFSLMMMIGGVMAVMLTFVLMFQSALS
jgi:hypothetical protein